MIDFDNKHSCHICNNNCIINYLSDEMTAVLNDNKTVIKYSPGEVIIKQSSFASKIKYVSTGVIKIIKEGNKGKKSIIKIVGGNSFLSIPINENQRKYSYTAIALTEVEICEIQESIIHETITRNQNFIDFILNLFYEDQQYLMNKLLIHSTRNSHGKLASSLLYINEFNTPEYQFFEYISRKDLAELSSISLESVNKIMQELNNDKIISVDKKGFQINQLGLLEKLSQIG